MSMTRRELLQGATAAGLAGMLGCSAPEKKPSTRMPALFVSHGSPRVALAKDDYTQSLKDFSGGIPTPRAIVMLSAHWVRHLPLQVGSDKEPQTIYDFYGFPDDLYKMEYRCPGDPTLAGEITERFNDAGLEAELNPDRGLDHGAWVPLSIAYPAAKVPVVQISFPPNYPPADLVQIGQALAPLRDRQILLIGSGGMVHNLRRDMEEDRDAKPLDWAREFDGWVLKRVEAMDTKSLLTWKDSAPHPEWAHPTTEHFDPIFMVMGMAASGDRPVQVYDKIHHGHMGMRTFALQS